MMLKKYLLTGIAALGLFGIAFIGCDVGVNPLLFDGSPLSAKFRIDAAGSSYGGSVTDSLHTILEDIEKNVDSIKVFNITLLIDSTSGTPAGNTISGIGGFSIGSGAPTGDTLLTLNNVSLSAFSSERSIFDPTLVAAGVIYNTAGITHLNAILKDPNTWPATITVGVLGSSSMSGLHFTAKVKIYTQVFTTP